MSEEEQNQVKSIFEGLAGESGNQVVLKPMSPEDQPVVITRPEFMRRMKEMQAMQGMSMDAFPDSVNLVVNTNHPLIASKLTGAADADQQKDLAEYLYNLARLNQNMLKGAELTRFINKSLEFLK
jgi:molecular chaperone HtpG